MGFETIKKASMLETMQLNEYSARDIQYLWILAEKDGCTYLAKKLNADFFIMLDRIKNKEC